jgi:LysM repeat protein
MKPVIWLTSSCALLLILTGCTQKAPDIGPGTGPYDSAGNYREDWADDPSKWRKPGKQAPADDLPVIAKNEEPPANSNPLVPQAASNPKPTSTRVESAPRETVKRSGEPKEVAAKPKPKTTVVKTKPKAKPKPKTTRYIVKSGDSLSRIASRTGSSVSAIQRANGISGTLIRPGQSLVIPKR